MKYYIIPETGEIKTEKELRESMPTTTFPKTIPPDLALELWGARPILDAPKPQYDTILKNCIKDGAAEDGLGNWVWNWTIVDKFEDIPGGPTKSEQEDEAIAQAQVAARESLKSACETAINAMIQAEVDAYNETNGLTLTDVKSCALYAQATGYTHQAFCAAVWAWNVQVWETARQVMGQALAGEITITTPEEALALLPEFTWEAPA